MPYVKTINHARHIAPDFFKLLAPFYPLPCTGDMAFILPSTREINVEMLL